MVELQQKSEKKENKTCRLGRGMLSVQRKHRENAQTNNRVRRSLRGALFCPTYSEYSLFHKVGRHEGAKSLLCAGVGCKTGQTNKLEKL